MPERVRAVAEAPSVLKMKNSKKEKMKVIDLKPALDTPAKKLPFFCWGPFTLYSAVIKFVFMFETLSFHSLCIFVSCCFAGLNFLFL